MEDWKNRSLKLLWELVARMGWRRRRREYACLDGGGGGKRGVWGRAGGGFGRGRWIDAVFCWKISPSRRCSLLLVAMCPRLITRSVSRSDIFCSARLEATRLV